jgi:GNAT superfamily N-acetyltransferase
VVHHSADGREAEEAELQAPDRLAPVAPEDGIVTPVASPISEGAWSADLVAEHRPIVVIDDVLPDPHAYRASALALPYGDIAAGAQVFHGIAPCVNPLVADRIAAELMPGARTTLSFFRRSPEGQQEPNFIHSDREMGDWTGILYLNPDPPPCDGTDFWRFLETGAVSGDFDEEAARDETKWWRWRHVDAKFNRLLIFQSDYFHSRAIEENYGAGDGARLIQVLFGRKPVPVGETIIRPATYADIPQIVDMGLRFLRSSEYRARMRETPDAMASTARWLVEAPGGALFVAEQGDGLVGMIGLALSVQPLSGELAAGELFWYVEPEARGRTGIKLLRRAESWAKAAGATVVVMVAPNANVERFYASRGYDRFEVTYQRRMI